MGERLTREQFAELRWLSRQRDLVWGGVYAQGGAPALYEFERLGLIESVATSYRVGKLTFPGGYRITDAGRSLLKENPNG